MLIERSRKRGPRILAALLACLLSLVAPPVSAARSEASLNRNVSFSKALADQIARASRRGNVLFSPAGLERLLSLLSLGAKGETRDQIVGVLLRSRAKLGAQTALNLARSLAETKLPVTVNNSLWLDNRLQPRSEFTKLARNILSAPVFPINFSSPKDRSKVQSWVAHATHGKISEIPLPRNSSFAAINALSYAGAWREPFDVKATTSADFHGPQTVRVQMMYSARQVDYYDEPGKEQYISMPFADGLEMLVGLPQSGRPNLAQVLGLLQHRDLLKRAFVRISLPRFEFRDHIDLVDILTRLGITAAFSAKADFANIFGTAHVPLTDAYQDGWVQVNERGAQVAVVSVGLVAFGPSRIIKFRADHPFAFAIDDPKSGSIIAAGIVDRP